MTDNNRIAEIAQYAADYFARGWKLTLLHDVGGVPGGICTCRLSAECRSAGKHPIANDWHADASLVHNLDELYRALGQRPTANIGIVTGTDSDLWVLDEDSYAGADLLGLINGREWPVTFCTKTGGGGRQWFFHMPADFQVDAGMYKILKAAGFVGFDIRGAAKSGGGRAGQVVAPPSISGKGRYSVLSPPGAPVTRAPAWLEDLLRPIQPERVDWSMQPTSELAMSGAAGGIVGPHPMGGSGAPTAAEIAYAQKGIRGACETFTHVDDDRRGAAAWTFACRLVELANLGGFVIESVRDEYMRAYAAARGNRPGGYTDHEALINFDRALDSVGARAAEMPPDVFAPYETRPFGGAPDGTGQPMTAAPVLDASGQPLPVVDPVDALIAEMLTAQQMRELPPPKPLINKMLDLDTVAWLIGKSGTYKSFFAIDWAGHIAAGKPWQGHDVHKGEVVYVVGEGRTGMTLRQRAWEEEYEPLDGVRFLPRPVQAKSPEWTVLVEAVRRIKPVLIVLDTQARVTVGLEENSNSDMGFFVHQADLLKQATGACVLVLHHIGRTGQDARGASALDGAQDSELRIERLAPFSVKLHTDKQKDQGEGEPIPLTLKRIDLGISPEGRELSSLVIVPATEALVIAPQPILNVGPARAAGLYQVIVEYFNPGDGGTAAQIRELFFTHPSMAACTGPGERQREARKKAWQRAWNELVGLGLIAKKSGLSARFKVIQLSELDPLSGVLTPNDDEVLPEWGSWEIYRDESRSGK